MAHRYLRRVASRMEEQSCIVDSRIVLGHTSIARCIAAQGQSYDADMIAIASQKDDQRKWNWRRKHRRAGGPICIRAGPNSDRIDFRAENLGRNPRFSPFIVLNLSNLTLAFSGSDMKNNTLTFLKPEHSVAILNRLVELDNTLARYLSYARPWHGDLTYFSVRNAIES